MGPFVILLLFLSYSAAQQCGTTITCVANASPGANSGTCICDEGYIGDGTTTGSGCSNINECAMGVDTCVDCCSGGVCVDKDGSYDCTCMPGYTGDGRKSGSGCSDVNECGMCDDCVDDAFCVNTPGSYDCVCYPGYEGDGFPGPDGTGCTDINECLDPDNNNCVEKATCVNYDGGYRCVCPAGYEGDGFDPPEGTGCTDIDECKTGRNDCPPDCCGGECTNTEGSYTCSCKSGYNGDGRNCTKKPKCKTDRVINKQTWCNGIKCLWRIFMTSVHHNADPMINGIMHQQPNLGLYTKFLEGDTRPVFQFFFVQDGDYFLKFLDIHLANNEASPVTVNAVAYYNSIVVQTDELILPNDGEFHLWHVEYQRNIDSVQFQFNDECTTFKCYLISDFYGEFEVCETGKELIHINPAQSYYGPNHYGTTMPST